MLTQRSEERRRYREQLLHMGTGMLRFDQRFPVSARKAKQKGLHAISVISKHCKSA